MSKIEYVDANTKGIDYIVGDIHGCFSRLQRQLDTMGFDPDADRLFALGDLIDRGPESDRALEFLEKPWFHSIMGNHEQLLCGAYEEYFNSDSNPDSRLNTTVWIQNGGLWGYNDNGILNDFNHEFSKLPFVIELALPNGKKVGLVHAEVYMDKNYLTFGHGWKELAEHMETLPTNMNVAYDSISEMCLWGRKRKQDMCEDIVEGIDHIFHGHTPVREILTLGNCTYIDTGACFGRELTIINPMRYA